MTRGIDLSNAVYLLVMEAIRHYARPDAEMTAEAEADFETRLNAHRDTISRLFDEVAK